MANMAHSDSELCKIDEVKKKILLRSVADTFKHFSKKNLCEYFNFERFWIAKCQIFDYAEMLLERLKIFPGAPPPDPRFYLDRISIPSFLRVR